MRCKSPVFHFSVTREVVENGRDNKNLMHEISASTDSRICPAYSSYPPSHARGIVGEAETALKIEHDDSAMAVDAVLQIIHGLGCDPLGKIARRHAISSPLGKHQLHDRFTPSGDGNRGALVIGV